MASDAKSWVHLAKRGKINQIDISKIKVWNRGGHFLLILLCNTEYMLLVGAWLGKNVLQFYGLYRIIYLQEF